jgi:RNA polymerase subunit RPABC4/transcription elongation factor Spt4
MYICNYCNRVLKQEYEKCPGCGGSSFKTKAFLGETIIKETPKGGYKINVENYKKSLRIANIFVIIGIALIVMPSIFALPFLLLGMGEIILFIPFGATLGLIMFGIAFSNKRKVKKSMNRAIKLSKNGMLVKGMPYKEVNTGTFVGNKYYKCIEVKFKNSAGVEIPLYSETKYDADIKNPETVDLLIDPNDYSNYFIDYEIY